MKGDTGNEPIQFRDSFSIADASRRQKSGCSHQRVELDVVRRMVECKDCGLCMEAFDYVLAYAKRVFVLPMVLGRQMKEEAESLAAEVEALKREKRNLQAAIARLKRRD